MSDATAQAKPRNGLFVDYCAKDFLDGTIELDPWEELAYRRIVDLIYASGDKLLDNDKKLAWSTKVGNRWKVIKRTLIDLGKIQVENGRITNVRCQKTLEKSAKKIAQKSIAGKASAEAAKLLSNNETVATDVDPAVASTVVTSDATNYLPNEVRKKERDASASPKTKSSRGTRLTKDWQPEPETFDWAAEQLSGDRGAAKFHVEHFIDYWIGVPGVKGTKLDWQATFKNRIRDIIERRTGKNGSGSHRRNDDLFPVGGNPFDLRGPGVAEGLGGGEPTAGSAGRDRSGVDGLRAGAGPCIEGTAVRRAG